MSCWGVRGSSVNVQVLNHGDTETTENTEKDKDDVQNAAKREKVGVLEVSPLILSMSSVALRVSVVTEF